MDCSRDGGAAHPGGRGVRIPGEIEVARPALS